MRIRLLVRASKSHNWIECFSQYGWKVRKADNSGWIQMAPYNTKVRSADDTHWIPVK